MIQLVGSDKSTILGDQFVLAWWLKRNGLKLPYQKRRITTMDRIIRSHRVVQFQNWIGSFSCLGFFLFLFFFFFGIKNPHLHLMKPSLKHTSFFVRQENRAPMVELYPLKWWILCSHLLLTILWASCLLMSSLVSWRLTEGLACCLLQLCTKRLMKSGSWSHGLWARSFAFYFP